MNHNFILSLIGKAKRAGMDLVLSEGNLVVEVREGYKMDSEIVAELKENKPAIIAFIKEEFQGQMAQGEVNAKVPDLIVQKRPARIPLSFAQERLWFIDRYEGSVHYHIPIVLRLNAAVSLESLNHAFQQLLQRHEILRTTYREEQGELYQEVQDLASWKIDHHDGQLMNDQDLTNYTENLISVPFNLSTDLMLRVDLISRPSGQSILVVVMHHIVSDDWSDDILLSELMEFYLSAEEHRPAVLTPLPLQYADYAIWQRSYLTAKVLDDKLSYWKERLHHVSPLNLPVDFSRPAQQSIKGTRCNYVIGNTSVVDKLHALSHKSGTSLFITLLSVFKVLLYRHSGQIDICVGSPIANRAHSELEGLIGFFLNTLALRSDLSGNPTFLDLLKEVAGATMSDYAHQDVPFEKLVETILVERDISRTPLFQVMFILQNKRGEQFESQGVLEVEEFEVAEVTSKFDLTFSVAESTEGLQLAVEYSTDLYRQTTIDRMAAHFERLIAGVVNDPNQRIAALPLLNDQEQELIHSFNSTGKPIGEECVLDLLTKGVALNRGKLALTCGKDKVTYAELDGLTNQLAHRLRAEGIESGDAVGVLLKRSIWSVISMIGIMKAGGVYVPVSMGYPVKRQRFISADAKCKVIIVNNDSPEFDFPGEVIDLLDGKALAGFKVSYPVLRVSLDSSAFIIYTSGSTGQPKGVDQTHRMLYNLILWDSERSKSLTDFKHLQYSSFSFDMSLHDVYYTLCTGGELYIVSEQLRLDMPGLARYIKTHGLESLSMPYSALMTLFNNTEKQLWEGNQLKLIISSGEQLLITGGLRDFLHDNPQARLFNYYGPSETHVVTSMSYSFAMGDVPVSGSIGKPLDNCEILVLDEKKELSGIGITGELFIGGYHLAKGYVGQPSLTTEKFIDHPFKPDERVYRTGDLARWMEDGHLEFLGRSDDQIKIRGYRIELGEIALAIEGLSTVLECVVIVHQEKTENQQLVAYVVMAAGQSMDTAEMMTTLKSSLPGYMVPQLWVELDTLPLSSNGKVDKKSLPPISVADSDVSVGPSSEAEEKLIAIWAEVLVIDPDKISVTANFFMLGGHSLMAIRVLSKVNQAFEVEVPVSELFTYPTIRGLAIRLASAKPKATPALSVVKRPDRIPLSYSQERLWFIDHYEGSSHYHLPMVLRFEVGLSVSSLEYALKQVMCRHEVLRTVFKAHEGIPYQEIRAAETWALKQHDAGNRSDRQIADLVESWISVSFDLGEDYLMRADLLTRESGDHILVLVIHHIASDGWSDAILTEELLAFYHAHKEGKPINLEHLTVQYADFAIWQRSYLKGDLLNEKMTYWRTLLEDVSPLNLPTDKIRPGEQSTSGRTQVYKIGGNELLVQLNALSKKQEVTLFMTLLSAFKVLLFRYSGQTDICVGSPIANRTQLELDRLIGFFVNTLALRTDLSGDPSFTELLEKVKNLTLAAYTHQEVPFEKVVEELVTNRDMSRTPLFQVMLVLQNNREALVDQPLGLEVHDEDAEDHTSKFDITFNLSETPTGLSLAVEYCTDLYESETIDRMVGHFGNLLTSIVKIPTQRISQLSLLDDKEKHHLLVSFNQTETHYNEDLVLDLFHKTVINEGNRTALIYEDQTMSFEELEEKSNQLAAHLQGLGVIQETMVGLYLDRSFEMVIGIMGILKAGGAYVPFSPEQPIARLQVMFEDSGLELVLIQESYEQQLAKVLSENVVTLSLDTIALEKSLVAPVIQIEPGQLFNVIYTSGSTGIPKGVMVDHGSVANLIKDHRDEYDLGVEEVIFQFSDYTFDASVQQLFMGLCYGGKVLLPSKASLLSEDIYEMLDRHGVTHLLATPGYLDTIKHVAALPSLRRVVSGGDALGRSLANHWAAYKPLFNEYGPTETTVTSVAYQCVEGDQKGVRPLIGYPIRNTNAYILDRQQNLVPIGVTGELYIGGKGVTRGYLNRPELTYEKFVANPFKPGDRLYRTGDIAKWHPSGAIEYLGREDDQIKLRGYRIELGEIELAIESQPQVKHAVVALKEDASGSGQLVGYIVLEQGESLNKETLNTQVKDLLPGYMVPTAWGVIDEIPLTKIGKVNRKALPDIKGSEGVYEAPVTSAEKALAAIWQELLKLDQISRTDNFFELGGHSLMALRMVSKVQDELDMTLTVKSIFAHPTLSELSKKLSSLSVAESLLTLESVTRPEKIPLSFSQERLWFLDKTYGSINYHMPAVLLLKGELDLEALELAFKAEIDRHEVLRTVIHASDDERFQVVKPIDDWRLEVNRMSELESQGLTREKFVETFIDQPFDLSKDLMIRVRLLEISVTEYLLVVVVHHIAYDGWSQAIFIEEINELYAAFSDHRKPILSPLKIQYADYAVWQRNFFNGDQLNEKLNYWKQKLSGKSHFRLNPDLGIDSENRNRGANVIRMIPREMSKELNDFSTSRKVSLYMTMLAAFKVLLYRHSGETDITIGTPIAGRHVQALEPLVGFFLNTLAINSELSENASFEQLLQQVRKTVLDAYDHQEVPFEKVVEHVAPERALNENPLFNIMFNMLNQPIEISKASDLSIEIAEEFPDLDAKFHLQLYVMQISDEIECDMLFDQGLFVMERIQAMMDNYIKILSEVIKDPNQSINKIELMTSQEQEEHEQIIDDFFGD